MQDESIEKRVLLIYEPHELSRTVVGASVPTELQEEFEALTVHSIWNTELPSPPVQLIKQYDAVILWNVRMPEPNGYDIVNAMAVGEARHIPLVCGSYAQGEPHNLIAHAKKRGLKSVWKFSSGMMSSLAMALSMAINRSNLGRVKPRLERHYQLSLPPSSYVFAEQALRLLASTPEELYRLTSREFEVLVSELLARDGWHVELTGRSADGGIDIFALNRAGSIPHSMLVQAKRYASHRKVGVSVVREVLYLVESHRVNSGLIATTSHFTQIAGRERDLHSWRLALTDKEALLEWLGTHATRT
jgi:hypothetical protein